MKDTLIVLLMLALAGCATKQPGPTPPPTPTPGSALTALQATVAGVEVLVATLAVTGTIKPETAIAIESGIAQLPPIFSQTATILSAGDPNYLVATKLWALYGPELVALKALPPVAQVWTNAIVLSINVFLSYYPTPPLNPPGQLSARQVNPSLAATHFDIQALNEIRGKAVVLENKLAALRR